MMAFDTVEICIGVLPTVLLKYNGEIVHAPSPPMSVKSTFSIRFLHVAFQQKTAKLRNLNGLKSNELKVERICKVILVCNGRSKHFSFTLMSFTLKREIQKI